ncbi:hypothetical protein ACUH7Y_16035 [Clostridium beijerinckii]|uniref:Uncharacterized protein n=1 Tax=Clostridium beijerinckii TaxID=1520 RepID=A0A7X9XMZ8_CLOBE|nr:hypothetical protein [Clostridium beijerinckii]NMF03708.1 hypothetical protein [Clostridium beijerinckii]
MDDKIISYLLEIISNENLINIAKNVKLKIKGFRTIQYKNGVMTPPKILIIKELLNVEYKTKINEYFSKDSKAKVELEIEKASSLNIMSNEDKIKVVKLLEQILSFSSNNTLKIEGREIDLTTIKDILLEDNQVKKEKHVEDKNNEKLINNDYSEQIEKLNKDMEVLKKKVLEMEKKRLTLEENNKKMISDIKNLKKEKIMLQEENEKIKKENQVNIKENEKYQNEFYSIKKKYDELKIINASQEVDINREKAKIEFLENTNENLKNKLSILENIEKERQKKDIKKVVVFGEIYSKEIKEMVNYEIYTVEIENVENFREVINECNEVWVLSYDISYLDKITIEEKIDSSKIKEFTSYKKLREYLKKEN